MIIQFNGRASDRRGSENQSGVPKKPVKWTGNFLVADKEGNALEASWKPNGAPPMTYLEAKQSALNVINELTARLYEQYKLPIKKQSFTLMCR